MMVSVVDMTWTKGMARNIEFDMALILGDHGRIAKDRIGDVRWDSCEKSIVIVSWIGRSLGNAGT